MREHVDIACLLGQPFCRRRYRSIYFDFKVSHVTAHRVARTLLVTSIGHLLDYYYCISSIIILIFSQAGPSKHIWIEKCLARTNLKHQLLQRSCDKLVLLVFSLVIISHPSSPQVWCFAGEDLQKRVQQLAQASVKGNNAASAVCKIVRHYRLAMQIATMEHEEDHLASGKQTRTKTSGTAKRRTTTILPT